MISATTIEEIFHTHYSPLRNYASKYIEDPTIAEDLVQNLFIQLWESNKIASVKKMDRFLIKSIKFKCIDYLRTKETKSKINFEDALAHKTTTFSEIKEEDIEPLMHYFTAKLPPKAREIFLLSRTSGLKYKEIAEELNLSIKTVENQMGHALQKMRVILKEHNFLWLIPFL